LLDSIDYHTHAKDAGDVLLALDISQASVLGHALGGRIARTIAADFPKMVNSVILLAVGDQKKPGEGNPDEAKATAKLFQPGANDEEIRIGMSYMVGDPDDVDRVWKTLAPSRYENPEAIRSEANIKFPVKTDGLLPGICPIWLSRGCPISPLHLKTRIGSSKI